MKRTIPFSTATSRDADRFDPSKQHNLVVLRDPKLLKKDKAYVNIDPPALMRHSPCPQDFSRTKEPRFKENTAIAAELREEKLALRNSKLLEKLLDRQQKQVEYAQSSVVSDKFLSNRGAAPKFSFPKGRRDHDAPMPHTSVSPSAERRSHQQQENKGNNDGAEEEMLPSSLTGDPMHSFVHATLPNVKGSLKLDKLTGRSGASPAAEMMRVHSSMDYTTRSKDKNATLGDRSESVPLADGKQKLGDFLTHSGGNSNDNSPVKNSEGGHTPPAAPPGGQHREFFLTDKDKHAIRDLRAPDLKNTTGRAAKPSHVLIGERYPFDIPPVFGGDVVPLLEPLLAEEKARKRHVSAVIPIGANGRSPIQPTPIANDDPLIRAALRNQEEINNQLCPEFKVYRARIAMQKKQEQMRKAKLESELREECEKSISIASNAEDWSLRKATPSRGDYDEDTFVVGNRGGGRRSTTTSHSTPSPSAAALTPLLNNKSRRDTSRTLPGSPASRPSASPVKKQRRHANLPREPLYTVRSSGRLDLNTDVLFSGPRFKELLQMHDLMIEKELNGGKLDMPEFEDEEEKKNKVFRLKQQQDRRRRGEEEDEDDDPQTLGDQSFDLPALTIAEKMKQGLYVSFEEVYAEADRRQHLLKLKCLSLRKDAPKGILESSPLQRRSTGLSFATAPDRVDGFQSSPSKGQAGELEAKIVHSISMVKQEHHSPVTRHFRAHVQLKEFYDKMTAEAQEAKMEKKDPHASLRRLSMHY